VDVVVVVVIEDATYATSVGTTVVVVVVVSAIVTVLFDRARVGGASIDLVDATTSLALTAIDP